MKLQRNSWEKCKRIQLNTKDEQLVEIPTNCCDVIKIRGAVLEFKHKPVLLKEVIQNLNIKENGVYVDGTLRRGRP